MNPDHLHRRYFADGTPGHNLIRSFFRRYADLYALVPLTELNDLVHEVYSSLLRTDFSDVEKEQHYVMRAIKLQCWTILDRASRRKGVMKNSTPEDESDEQLLPHSENTLREVEERDLIWHINLYKGAMRPGDVVLLNLLIDDHSRDDIAKELGLNLNTLDTQIRRLRIKLGRHLESLGYTSRNLRKFSTPRRN